MSPTGLRKRILVTGGAGFLGSHLCDHLLASGAEVICLDNFSTGALRNIGHMMAHPRFRLVDQDVTVPFHAEVDEIYNLACPASPAHYQADPVKTLRTNVEGILNMLRLARLTGARIFQASTSEVYGDPSVHPQPESYLGNVNPTGPRACYDEGKRCAETLMFDYQRCYGTDIRVARIFNTYGPRMHPEDGRVVSNFIVQALRGQELTIYGGGLQTRSFCYVDDLIDGFTRLMAHSDVRGPVNIGNPAEFTMRELAELVIDLTGTASKIVYRPRPQDDPMQRRPDITRAETELGWRPLVAVREGLARTIAYFDARLRERPVPIWQPELVSMLAPVVAMRASLAVSLTLAAER